MLSKHLQSWRSGEGSACPHWHRGSQLLVALFLGSHFPRYANPLAHHAAYSSKAFQEKDVARRMGESDLGCLILILKRFINCTPYILKLKCTVAKTGCFLKGRLPAPTLQNRTKLCPELIIFPQLLSSSGHIKKIQINQESTFELHH